MLCALSKEELKQQGMDGQVISFEVASANDQEVTWCCVGSSSQARVQALAAFSGLEDCLQDNYAEHATDAAAAFKEHHLHGFEKPPEAPNSPHSLCAAPPSDAEVNDWTPKADVTSLSRRLPVSPGRWVAVGVGDRVVVFNEDHYEMRLSGSSREERAKEVAESILFDAFESDALGPVPSLQCAPLNHALAHERGWRELSTNGLALSPGGTVEEELWRGNPLFNASRLGKNERKNDLALFVMMSANSFALEFDTATDDDAAQSMQIMQQMASPWSASLNSLPVSSGFQSSAGSLAPGGSQPLMGWGYVPQHQGLGHCARMESSTLTKRVTWSAMRPVGEHGVMVPIAAHTVVIGKLTAGRSSFVAFVLSGTAVPEKGAPKKNEVKKLVAEANEVVGDDGRLSMFVNALPTSKARAVFAMIASLDLPVTGKVSPTIRRQRTSLILKWSQLQLLRGGRDMRPSIIGVEHLNALVSSHCTQSAMELLSCLSMQNPATALNECAYGPPSSRLGVLVRRALGDGKWATTCNAFWRIVFTRRTLLLHLMKCMEHAGDKHLIPALLNECNAVFIALSIADNSNLSSQRACARLLLLLLLKGARIDAVDDTPDRMCCIARACLKRLHCMLPCLVTYAERFAQDWKWREVVVPIASVVHHYMLSPEKKAVNLNLVDATILKFIADTAVVQNDPDQHSKVIHLYETLCFLRGQGVEASHRSLMAYLTVNGRVECVLDLVESVKRAVAADGPNAWLSVPKHDKPFEWERCASAMRFTVSDGGHGEAAGQMCVGSFAMLQRALSGGNNASRGMRDLNGFYLETAVTKMCSGEWCVAPLLRGDEVTGSILWHKESTGSGEGVDADGTALLFDLLDACCTTFGDFGSGVAREISLAAMRGWRTKSITQQREFVSGDRSAIDPGSLVSFAGVHMPLGLLQQSAEVRAHCVRCCGDSESMAPHATSDEIEFQARNVNYAPVYVCSASDSARLVGSYWSGAQLPDIAPSDGAAIMRSLPQRNPVGACVMVRSDKSACVMELRTSAEGVRALIIFPPGESIASTHVGDDAPCSSRMSVDVAKMRGTELEEYLKSIPLSFVVEHVREAVRCNDAEQLANFRKAGALSHGRKALTPDGVVSRPRAMDEAAHQYCPVSPQMWLWEIAAASESNGVDGSVSALAVEMERWLVDETSALRDWLLSGRATVPRLLNRLPAIGLLTTVVEACLRAVHGDTRHVTPLVKTAEIHALRDSDNQHIFVRYAIPLFLKLGLRDPRWFQVHTTRYARGGAVATEMELLQETIAIVQQYDAEWEWHKCLTNLATPRGMAPLRGNIADDTALLYTRYFAFENRPPPVHRDNADREAIADSTSEASILAPASDLDEICGELLSTGRQLLAILREHGCECTLQVRDIISILRSYYSIPSASSDLFERFVEALRS